MCRVVRALLYSAAVREIVDSWQLADGRTGTFLALDQLFPVARKRIAVREFMEDFRRRERMPLPVGVSLRWRVMPGLPSILTDAAKLTLILHRLLGNAIRFTTAGWIVVSATDLPDRDKVCFRVDDTGPGIEPEHLAPLFEPLQCDATVGLAIVRRYVSLLDGEIAVRSERGIGTSFDVRLPYRPRPFATTTFRAASYEAAPCS